VRINLQSRAPFFRITYFSDLFGFILISSQQFKKKTPFKKLQVVILVFTYLKSCRKIKYVSQKRCSFCKRTVIYNKTNTFSLFNFYTQKKPHPQFKRLLFLISDRFLGLVLRRNMLRILEKRINHSCFKPK